PLAWQESLGGSQPGLTHHSNFDNPLGKELFDTCRKTRQSVQWQYSYKKPHHRLTVNFPLLFDLCPRTAHLCHLRLVRLHAAITGGGISLGETPQARRREGLFCIEPLPNSVGLLIFLAWIPATSPPPQQQAIDLTYAARSLSSYNRHRCSLLTSRRYFT